MEFWTTVAQIIPVLFLAVAIETRGSHRRSRSEAAKALFVAVLSLGMLMELFALMLIEQDGDTADIVGFRYVAVVSVGSLLGMLMLEVAAIMETDSPRHNPEPGQGG